MTGPVAQIVSLTVYSNAYLSGKEPFSFDLSNSTAQFCERIQYIDWVKKLFKYHERMIAKNPDDWVKILKNSGIKSLWLHYVSSQNTDLNDRYSAGFVGGGGRWLIEASYENKSDYWEARWEVGNKDAQNKRIWVVTYGRISRNDIKRQYKLDSLAAVSQRLEQNLKEIKRFAESHDIEYFGKCFEKGLKCLNSLEPLEFVYHKDLLPSSIQNIGSLQILCSCQAAWVFGGMGSWNDMGFNGNEQEVYEEVSGNLYKTICEAIPAAVNFMIG
jgi:hypothetical protein